MVLLSKRKKAFKVLLNAILYRLLASTVHLLLVHFQLTKQQSSMTVLLWPSLIISHQSEPKRFKSDLRMLGLTMTVSLQSTALVFKKGAASNRSAQLTELYELLNYEPITTSVTLRSPRQHSGNLCKMWNSISKLLEHTKVTILPNHTASDFDRFF